MTEPTELTDAEIREWRFNCANFGDDSFHEYVPRLVDALLAAREQLAQAEARGEWAWQLAQSMVPTEALEAAEQRAEAAEADCAALRDVVAAVDCRCDMRFIRECPDCGAPLKAVPEHRYLNSDQWDAIKAGDFFCTGTCTSDVPSRKKYWRYRHLRQYVHGDVCPRCAILASPNPGAGLLAAHAEALVAAEERGRDEGWDNAIEHRETEMEKLQTELEQARTRIAELEAIMAKAPQVVPSPDGAGWCCAWCGARERRGGLPTVHLGGCGLAAWEAKP